MKHLRAALMLLLISTVLFGFAYPLLITGVAQLAFPKAAAGSLILSEEGQVRGSELLGQQFNDPKYFWGRLSATTPPYNAGYSNATHASPRHAMLAEAARVRAAEFHKYTDSAYVIPRDLLTHSASGLDPHISPEAAAYQLSRVATQRNLAPEVVEALVAEFTEPRALGFIGEPRVNVLLLNLALDKAK